MENCADNSWQVNTPQKALNRPLPPSALYLLDALESLYPCLWYQASDFKRSLEKLGFGGLGSAEKSLLVKRFDPAEEGMVSARDINNSRTVLWTPGFAFIGGNLLLLTFSNE